MTDKQKLHDEFNIPFGAKDSELQEVRYRIPDGFHAEIVGNEVIIKKGDVPADNDLDAEIARTYNDNSVADCSDLDHVSYENIARHFANWQLEQIYKQGEYYLREKYGDELDIADLAAFSKGFVRGVQLAMR